MNIRQEFKTQIDSAEVITEETIQKIIDGRKKGVHPDMKEEHVERMLDEDIIREQYPIGDKSLYVIVYPSKAEYNEEQENPSGTRLTVEVTKILESELDEFAENHTSLGKHNGSEIPRYQKNNENCS